MKPLPPIFSALLSAVLALFPSKLLAQSGSYATNPEVARPIQSKILNDHFADLILDAGDFTFIGSNGDLATAANYAGGTAPGNGQNIFFVAPGGGSATNTTLSSVNSFTFNSGAGGFTISGNALNVNEGITTNSGSAQTINNDLTLGGNLSFTATSGSLSFGGSIDTNGKTLTVAGSRDTTFSGVVTGTGNLVKNGTGTAILDGSYSANGHTGSTTINGGILRAGVGSLVQTSNPIQVNSSGTLLLFGTGRHIGANTGVTLNGGTFNTGGESEPGTVGQTIGALTLSANSTIDLASGASVLNFGQSNSQTWSGILSILNWSGTLATGGGTDQLRFGNSSLNGLTAGQLLEIQFVNPVGLSPGTYGALWATSLNGEVVPDLVPVPEPSTWIAASLVAGVIFYFQCRRTPTPDGSSISKQLHEWCSGFWGSARAGKITGRLFRLF